MLKRNELKNLIYIQENKPCDEQTIKGLFRSMVEPILKGGVECLILLRLEEKSKRDFQSILKRLEFSNAIVYDYSDEKINGKFENVLDENLWDNTEFVYVMSERFGASFVFDYTESEREGFADFYLLHNSRTLTDSLDIISANSTVDLSEYPKKWHPDRRDNIVLNDSIHMMVEALSDMNQEVMISELEKEKIVEDDDLKSQLDFITKKSRCVAHELRNQLSICDLYSNIIEKRLDKVSLDGEALGSMKNAVSCIQKAVKIAHNSLLDMRSMDSFDIQKNCLGSLLESSVELAKAYVIEKDIELNLNIDEKISVMVDEEKFLSVLINILKNAIESIEEKGEVSICASSDDDEACILISNNGKCIDDDMKAKIYQEGFTTKSSGSGLGLHICKKSLEGQFARLELKKSDEDSTDFEIKLPRV